LKGGHLVVKSAIWQMKRTAGTKVYFLMKAHSPKFSLIWAGFKSQIVNSNPGGVKYQKVKK
jgi:hypothetical protein